MKTDQFNNSEEERKAVLIFIFNCENEKREKFIVGLQKTKQKFFKELTVYYSTFPVRELARRASDGNFEPHAVYTIPILDFTFDQDKNEPEKFKYNVKLTDIETCKSS